MLKKGEQVTVDGWQARNGSNFANAKSVDVNGRSLSAASSNKNPESEKGIATSGAR